MSALSVHNKPGAVVWGEEQLPVDLKDWITVADWCESWIVQAEADIAVCASDIISPLSQCGWFRSCRQSHRADRNLWLENRWFILWKWRSWRYNLPAYFQERVRTVFLFANQWAWPWQQQFLALCGFFQWLKNLCALEHQEAQSEPSVMVHARNPICLEAEQDCGGSWASG